jgi:uncharacterized protein
LKEISRMRIFFCTDVHGSDICFKKFINAGKFYKSDVVILGGDTTGKMIVFLVDQEDGTYMSTYSGKEEVFKDGAEVEEHEKNIRNSGYYPHRVNKGEMRELNSDPAKMNHLFDELMLETTGRWMKIAEDRLKDTKIRCIVAPGNDDHEEIDEVIKASSRVEYGEGQLMQIGKHEMISCGWTNPTPWDTPRECDEEHLAERIEGLAKQVKDMSKAIFNLHAPPYGSGLDAAPQVTGAGMNVKMVGGGQQMVPVGSTAVRDAIMKYQPLLGLHGHIHESKGVQKLGKTMCINPGSAYGDWVLQGVLIDLNDKGQVAGHLLVTG